MTDFGWSYPAGCDGPDDDFDDELDGDNSEATYGPMREPCPECSEPAVAAWDHLKTCPHYEEMMDLPF